MSPSSRQIIQGTHRVPGDKSLTHRALMLAALAPGQSVLGGALASLDARSSARVLRALGAEISPLRTDATVRIRGRQRFRPPATVLQCGNSGTTARLLLGLLAGHPLKATLTGDASLRRRPMRRVTDPLVRMGAKVTNQTGDGLPLTIQGGDLIPLEWRLPVASAQIKSALLLAGMVGGCPVTLHQPSASRDHTERLLRHFGFTITEYDGRLDFLPTGRLESFEFQVPGDPSSAAFLVAAALLADSGEIQLVEVGCNPSRLGFLNVLRRMGANVKVAGVTTPFGEPIGEWTARPAKLNAVTVEPGEVAAVIDEIPILACVAARASGVSTFRGLAELRVKESDRLALLAENLRAVGVEAAAEGDDLHLVGTDRRLKGKVRTGGDHRIAMAFTVLGLRPGNRIVVDDLDCAAVSFPGFPEALAALVAAR
ncbi:MAG: 3-phosphoshikimate 1-carboxyvinyltransferase [Gemmatimonadales bacterium]|nr:3-phosphoshikimate 1-carboxyvinyltransferase [Gemmatimonadales bacterium]